MIFAASVISPSTSSSSAPRARISSRIGRGVSVGAATWAGMSAAAAYAAAAEPAFPAVGSATACIPTSFARDTASASPRALKLPVGFCPSSLTQTRSISSASASRGASTSGVNPSPRVMRFSGSRTGSTSA